MMNVSILWDRLRQRIPLKIRDTAKGDRIRARQRARFAGIGRRAARRDSFRVHWREQAHQYPYTSGTRRERRARALRDWRQAKGHL